MKRFDFKDIHNWLIIILIISITIVISIDFWLINILEIVKGGFEFGKIIYALCMAYIASYIFYYVTVHIKNKRDKKNLRPYIRRNISNVLSINIGIHNSIINSAQPKIIQSKQIFLESDYINLLNEILNKGDRTSPLQAISHSQIKMSTLIFLISQITSIEKILKDSILVSQNHFTEFVTIANNILDTELFRYFSFNEYLITSSIVQLNTNNIETFASWLFEYDKANYELFEYLKRI